MTCTTCHYIAAAVVVTKSIARYIMGKRRDTTSDSATEDNSPLRMCSVANRDYMLM